MWKRASFLGITALTIMSSFYAADPIENILDKLKKYTDEYPQEKVYLHLDKPYYASGEIIWLKAYLTAGSFHQPSPLSYTINVELINEKQEVVQQIKLLSKNGLANASIHLSDSTASGNYLLRAYTPWMKNFSADYFFNKEIKIFGANTAQLNATKQKVDLQFFPEGGNLVTGLRNKVGFKLIDSNGLGKVSEIKILEDNIQIEKAASNQFGMGFFYITPKEGKKYSVTTGLSSEPFALPDADAASYLLAVTNQIDRDDVIIRLQTTNATVNRKDMTLLIHCRGAVSFVAKPDLTNNLAFVKVPKETFLSGISHITLFDAGATPVAERLVFVNKKDRLDISITPNKTLYKPREQVSVSVEAKNSKGQPVAGNFSMAVLDNGQIKISDDRENIVSSLWLSSDLKGHIENPGYYFNAANKDADDALDILLLTQGWRRFIWKDLMNDKWPAINTIIDQGLTISGKLLDNVSKKEIVGGKVIYLANGGDIDVVKTDDNGIFNFKNLIFSDTADVVLQGENKKGNRTVIFKMDQEQPVPVNYVFKAELAGSKEGQLYFENVLRKQQQRAEYTPDGTVINLKEIEVTASRIEQIEAQKMYGRASKTLKSSDMRGSEFAQHPLVLLQGRVAGVQITGSGFDYNIVMRGAGSISGSTPLIMIDNVPVDKSVLNSLRAQDIESIDVYKGSDAAVFGSQGGNGAILFFTKKGGYSSSNRLGIQNLRLGGYSTPKEFYSPKYNVTLPEHAFADYRTTIFWAPEITTDSLGKASVTFYNSDYETNITGIIEGISSVGTPGVRIFHYEVSKQ